MKKRILTKSLVICLTAISSINAADLAGNAQMLNQKNIYQNDDLWQRMRDGFALDHRETPEVKYWEKKYGSPKYFNIIMKNAYPYLYFVVGEMERRGIPTELALVPIVESTYNPNAVSPAGISTGMWQFLTGSGKRFGMNINSQLDERQDIVKSTRGAVNYFLYLNSLFGSWELAIAAYNWGEGNINNAVNKAGSKDFYELDVRDVTRQYVPKVIALANIIQNPSKFGIKLIDMPNRPYFAIAYPSSPIKVSDFMNKANLSADLNKKLNPQFKSTSYLVTNEYILALANNNPYAKNYFNNNTPTTVQIDNANDNSAPVVNSNDNSDTTSNQDTQNSDPIGALMGSSVAVTQVPVQQTTTQVNSNPINILTEDDSATSKSALILITASGSFTNYSVAPGDTLYSISKKFSISVDQIKADNELTNNSLSTDQILKIRNQT